MKMYMVAEINDTEFDTENKGFMYTSMEEAQEVKKKLEEANPEIKYIVWEIN